MAAWERFLVGLALLLAPGGCSDREAPQPGQPATAPTALEERLFGTLDGRRQWPSNAVKLWLKNPTVALDIKANNAKPVRVEAWNHNENDYNIAMMRLNGGGMLYAITNAEFEELRTCAAAENVLTEGN